MSSQQHFDSAGLSLCNVSEMENFTGMSGNSNLETQTGSIDIVKVTNEGVQSASQWSHDPTSYPSPICLSSVLGGVGEEELGHDASLTQISAPFECYQLCSKHPEKMNLINQSFTALNWVDPPALQEQSRHSCKSKFCDCPLQQPLD